MILSLLLASAFGWTRTTLFDAPVTDDPVRSVAVVLDGSNDEVMVIADVLDVSASTPALLFRFYDGSSWGSAVAVDGSSLGSTGRPFQPGLAAIDGATDVHVLGMRAPSTVGLREAYSVTRSSGAAGTASDVFPSFSSNQQNAGAMVLEDLATDERHVCNTVMNTNGASGDDILGSSSQVGGSWSESTYVNSADTEDHCSIAVTSTSELVVAWHDPANNRVRVSLPDDPPGTSSVIVDLTNGGHDLDNPSVAVDSNDTVHIAVWDRDDDVVLYATCADPNTTDCSSQANWSSWYTVNTSADGGVPVLALDDADNPYVGYLFRDGANANRVRLAACPDHTNFDFDVDGGIDGTIGGEGWASDGSAWNNNAHARPSVDADDSRVAVTYLVQDPNQSGQFIGRFAVQTIPGCP